MMFSWESEAVKLKLVAIGDSITWGYPYGPLESWVKMAADSIGIEIINRGVNGETTNEMMARFEPDVIGAHPDACIIMGGANDAFAGESASRVAAHIDAMVDAAKKAGMRVFLGMPPQILISEFELVMLGYRKRMEEICLQQNIRYIDFPAAFLDETGTINASNFLDDAHPSRFGYERMGECAAQFLRTALI